MTVRRFGCAIAAGVALGLAWVASLLIYALRHIEGDL